jgi:hypothetical protein
VAFGVAWLFLLNAVSFLSVILALLWWKPPPSPPRHLPAERFWSAMHSGIRYARASGPLKATLIRAVAFFLFGSAYWAVLPLIVRQQLGGGPALYGILLLHRCGSRGRRLPAAVAEGKVWAGQYGGNRHAGNGGGPARLRVGA